MEKSILRNSRVGNANGSPEGNSMESRNCSGGRIWPNGIPVWISGNWNPGIGKMGWKNVLEKLESPHGHYGILELFGLGKSFGINGSPGWIPWNSGVVWIGKAVGDTGIPDPWESISPDPWEFQFLLEWPETLSMREYSQNPKEISLAQPEAIPCYPDIPWEWIPIPLDSIPNPTWIYSWLSIPTWIHSHS